MTELRLRFEKSGKAVYISHLDLMRTFQRVFKRAGLDIKYSDGFNPHARIFIAIPLSLGFSSTCELIDIELNGEAPADIIERVNAVMPSGIRVTDAYSEPRKFRDIKWLNYSAELIYDNGFAPGTAEKIAQLLAQDELIVSKRTKRKNEDTNIAPGLANVQVSEKGRSIIVNADCAFNETMVLNPIYLVSAIEKYLTDLAPDFARYVRLENKDVNFEIFR